MVYNVYQCKNLDVVTRLYTSLLRPPPPPPLPLPLPLLLPPPPPLPLPPPPQFWSIIVFLNKLESV